MDLLQLINKYLKFREIVTYFKVYVLPEPTLPRSRRLWPKRQIFKHLIWSGFKFAILNSKVEPWIPYDISFEQCNLHMNTIFIPLIACSRKKRIQNPFTKFHHEYMVKTVNSDAEAV